MFKNREIISVFDIEGDLVKLAQIATVDTQRSLYRLIIQRTQTQTREDLVKTISSLIRDYNVAGTRVIVNLPRYKVTVKNLKLPSVNPEEIENMVSLQATKQLPYSPDKIISGYKILGKDENGYSQVMAVLVHRDIVDSLLNIFSQPGVYVERLALSSEALSLWYIHRQREDKRSPCVCLVDIARHTLEIEIVKGGGLDFSRSISLLPSGDIEKDLADEIRKTLFTYSKSSAGMEVTKLILTGRGSIVDKEAPMLKKDLGLPTVYVDALRLWPRVENAILPKREDISKHSFTAVLSSGFNYDKLEIDLMPQEIRFRRVSRIIKQSLVMSAILFLCILIGIGGIITKKIVEKKKYLAAINRRLKDIEPKVDRLTRLSKITDVIKKQLDINASSIDIIRELYNKIPPELSLTIFDYEDSSSCLLRGTAQKLSDVFKFISILEESIYFENVKVRYATKRVIKKEEVTDFEIICQLAQLDIK